MAHVINAKVERRHRMLCLKTMAGIQHYGHIARVDQKTWVDSGKCTGLMHSGLNELAQVFANLEYACDHGVNFDWGFGVGGEDDRGER